MKITEFHINATPEQAISLLNHIILGTNKSAVRLKLASLNIKGRTKILELWAWKSYWSFNLTDQEKSEFARKRRKECEKLLEVYDIDKWLLWYCGRDLGLLERLLTANNILNARISAILNPYCMDVPA